MFSTDDVLQALAHHIGQKNGARADILVAEITGQPGPDLAGQRLLRAHITALRMSGHHVCAHPCGGYFMADTPEELEQTCEFLYGRAMTGLQQIARMKNISLPDLRGQLHLPT